MKGHRQSDLIVMGIGVNVGLLFWEKFILPLHRVAPASWWWLTLVTFCISAIAGFVVIFIASEFLFNRIENRDKKDE